jgi:hypothetical protein
MVRPTAIKIGPHTYTVYWSKASWAKYLNKGDDQKYAGRTQNLLTRIFINAWSMSLSQQQETLLHETLHACWFVSGWGDDEYGWPNEDKDQIEEHLIRLNSPILLQVLQDNPVLIEWLTE